MLLPLHWALGNGFWLVASALYFIAFLGGFYVLWRGTVRNPRGELHHYFESDRCMYVCLMISGIHSLHAATLLIDWTFGPYPLRGVQPFSNNWLLYHSVGGPVTIIWHRIALRGVNEWRAVCLGMKSLKP